MRALLISFGVFVSVMAVVYASLFRLDVLPRVAMAPGWSLQDENGDRFTSEDVRGRITVYTFSHARNDRTSRQPEPVFRELQRRLAEDAGLSVPVQLLTISIDPERDSLAVIRDWSRAAEADPDVWRFLRGDESMIERVAREGFGVYYRKDDVGTVHVDPVFVVVDGTGIERARYRIGLPEAESLLRDIRSLTREARAAEGAARLAYEAAHLFSCYSRVNL